MSGHIFTIMCSTNVNWKTLTVGSLILLIISDTFSMNLWKWMKKLQDVRILFETFPKIMGNNKTRKNKIDDSTYFVVYDLIFPLLKVSSLIPRLKKKKDTFIHFDSFKEIIIVPMFELCQRTS